MNQPRIFLSNDDGIRSPGLRAAVEAVADLGEIIVVAPTDQQTGMGRALTGNPKSSLTPYDFGIKGKDIKAFHCECTPAMAVHHGLLAMCADRKPDLIISGINYGENVGTGITASGTVGAALEGANLGVLSLAVSKQTAPGDYHEYTEQDWTAAIHFTTEFAKKMLTATLPEEIDLINLNIPMTATSETDWRITRLSKEKYWKTSLPDPGPHSRIEDAEVTIRIEPDRLDPLSDVYTVIIDKLVSVTPLSLDFTTPVESDLIFDTLTAAREN